MKFLKENSSVIIRLIITHIGMSVFGLVIFLATNQQGEKLMLLASIFSTLFFAVIAYTTMWEYGNKDKPAIDAGRLKFKPSNAFFASLTAETLGIILIIVYFVSSMFTVSSDTATTVYTISYLLLYVVQSCISGFMLYFYHIYESALLNAVCLMLLPVVVTVASTLGYSCGAKGVHIIPQKENNKK